MSNLIEHFVLGSAGTLRRLRAALPAEIEVCKVPGGLVLRENLAGSAGLDAAVARIEALVVAHGAVYDGHGQSLTDGLGDLGLDLQRQRFSARTGIAAGSGFALPLPDGRYGHGVFLGDNTDGHVLVDISTHVSDEPATVDLVSRSPRRYRQPILVWHTGFVVRTLIGSAAPIADLPCEVIFRCTMGWPDPAQIASLEVAFGIEGAGTPEGWENLILAMARAGQGLPGLDHVCLWSARVNRTGKLKLIEDYTPVVFADNARAPMPWQPSTVEDVMRALCGGPDIIAARDRVT
jgi:hypothetical protein